MPTPQATTRDLGRAIRHMRKAQGMTIEDLAGIAKMHPTYLQKIEVKGRNLSWNKLAGIASGLETTIAAVASQAVDEFERSNATSTEQPQPSGD